MTYRYFLSLTFIFLVSFSNHSNFHISNNAPEHNHPNIIRTESTKTTMNSFQKFKDKCSSSLESLCKCFKRNKNRPSSINIKTDKQCNQNGSYSSVPALKSSPPIPKSARQNLEGLEYTPCNNPSLLSPQTVPVRKKISDLNIRENDYIVTEVVLHKNTQRMVDSLNKYLKEEKEKLESIKDELNKESDVELDTFELVIIENYKEIINQHLTQIDYLEEKIKLATNKELDIKKETESIEHKSCSEIKSPRTPNSSKVPKSLKYFESPKQPKSAKYIKHPKNDCFDNLCKTPQIRTLNEINEDEEFDYKYNVDFAQHLGLSIEKKILHIKALETLVNSFKEKQNKINKNYYACSLEESNLNSIVTLSLELIDLNSLLKKEQKDYCEYSKKVETYKMKDIKGRSVSAKIIK